jgi:putative SOS response-associated peptidase YedK
MCGRFTQAYTWQELVALYRLTVAASNLQPRYNIVPTTVIDVVVPEASISRSALVTRLTGGVQAGSFVQVIRVGYASSQSQGGDRRDDDESRNASKSHC